MTRTLLTERFKLTMHRETREVPVYALVIAKNGPKLKKAATDGDDGLSVNAHGYVAKQTSVELLARQLQAQVGRIVLDRTGLAGAYDFKLEFTPQRALGNAGDGSEPAGPTIFTALQEQLGLKLESSKAPVEIVVIDHVEKPSEN
jgi:uncharacterized protein (TIGR03435 family)